MWANEGLPADQLAVENASIVSNCARWPLMIDPQLQGVTWIKQREAKNDLKASSPTLHCFIGTPTLMFPADPRI